MNDRQPSRAMQLFLGLGVAASVAACASEAPKPPLTDSTPPAPTAAPMQATPAPSPTVSPTLLPEGGEGGEGGEG